MYAVPIMGLLCLIGLAYLIHEEGIEEAKRLAFRKSQARTRLYRMDRIHSVQIIRTQTSPRLYAPVQGKRKTLHSN
jgi:hypothetical protein